MVSNATLRVRSTPIAKRQAYAAKSDLGRSSTVPEIGALREAAVTSRLSEVHDIEVEDLSSCDDLVGDSEMRLDRKAKANVSIRQSEPQHESPLDSQVQVPRRQSEAASEAVQETMIRELTSARRLLTLQQEQALSRVEKACVESVTKMETTLTKLRFDKARLEEQLKLSEEVRRAHKVSGNMMFTPPASRAPLPMLDGIPEPNLSAPPMAEAPKMELSALRVEEDEVVTQTNSSGWQSVQAKMTMLKESRSRTMNFDPVGGGSTLTRAKAAEARAGRGKNVFVDASSMKEKVKLAVMKPEYNVFDYYKDEGTAQRIARSAIFENTTLIIVFINAIWIWIDTDFNKADTLIRAHPIFIIVENFFCTYFFGELLVRFFAFKRKWHCLQDAWFNFDTVLVLLMIMETWVMALVVSLLPEQQNVAAGGGAHQLVRLVRLMRLTRMARMVRLLRAIPELMVLFKSVVVAIRSVVFTLCLLVVFIYIFALIFVQLDQSSALGGVFEDNLQTVPDAMAFLLLRGILPDLADHVYSFGNSTVLGSVIFLLFILVASLTIMNMLMGVLVQVIGAVSDVERERMTVQWVKVKLLEMMESAGIGTGAGGMGDDDGNLQISKNAFQQLLLNPKAAKMVQEVGVDVVGLVDFADFIFEDDRELSFAQFMELVLQLRGSNIATVKDIVDLRKFIQAELQSTTKKELDRGIKVLLKEFRSLMGKAMKDQELPQEVRKVRLSLTLEQHEV